jgi:transposase
LRSRAPLALEAVKRIDAVFDIEREINGMTADERLAVRRARLIPHSLGVISERH